MAGSATTGIRGKILELMNANPKELFSVQDIMTALDIENSMPVDNSLRTIRIDGLIHRHKEKDVDNDYQYAVSISPSNIQSYTPTRSGGNNKPRKSKALTTKEIRSMFAANFNNMAKIEDAVMTSLERLDELEKELARIRNVLR